jgi:hypothetical protein
MTTHLQEHMMMKLVLQEQVQVLVLVLVLVQQGLGQVMDWSPMELLSIHRMYLSSSIRKPGTLT